MQPVPRGSRLKNNAAWNASVATSSSPTAHALPRSAAAVSWAILRYNATPGMRWAAPLAAGLAWDTGLYGRFVVDAVVAAPVVGGGRVAVAALVAVVVLADAVAAVVAIAAPPL